MTSAEGNLNVVIDNDRTMRIRSRKTRSTPAMLALQSIRGLLTSAANTTGSTLGDTAAVEEVDCANNRCADNSNCARSLC